MKNENIEPKFIEVNPCKYQLLSSLRKGNRKLNVIFSGSRQPYFKLLAAWLDRKSFPSIPTACFLT